MKICYIQALFDRTFSEKLINEIMRCGHSVVHYRYTTRKADSTALDLPEYSYLQNSDLSLRSPLFFRTRIKHAAELFANWVGQADERPQLVYTHFCFSDGYLAYKAHMEFGIPYVLAFRNEDMNAWYYWKRPDMVSYRNRILLNASAIVFINACYLNKLCSRLSKDLQDNVRQKAVVVTNGIDDFWLNNERGGREDIDLSSCVRLLTVGDVNKNKNQRSVVDAVRLLRQRGLNVRYTVVGRVRDESIAKYISDCEGTEILPYAKPEQLLHIYDDADIFVMPSIHETFGLTYIEAMTRGLPVVYTCGEGISGLFSEGSVGYGVNCRDVNEIAGAIERIIGSYYQMSACAVCASRDFSWAKTANKLMSVFNRFFS